MLGSFDRSSVGGCPRLRACAADPCDQSEWPRRDRDGHHDCGDLYRPPTRGELPAEWPTARSAAPVRPRHRSAHGFSLLRRARSYRWDEGRIWRRRQTGLRADRLGRIRRRGVRTGQVDQVSQPPPDRSRERWPVPRRSSWPSCSRKPQARAGAQACRRSASEALSTTRCELAVNVVAAIVLLVSGFAFLRRARRGAIRCALLAGASFLLAGARLQYLAIPAVATNWISPREGLRLAAYAMLLASAYWEYARAHRAEAVAAISSERERIARELHDGLAQDLVCIAAQSQRLGVELQREHPLMVAARNALATSRGVIADLSASTAPTTEAALRVIADDLRHRHGLEIDVRVEMTTALGGSNDLDLVDREHIVRIAREAIVNAALHGRARRVDVLLSGTGGGDLVMRITDDGWGIADAHGCGMGLRTMRARAAALGGHLSAHSGPAGGTQLEVTVP